MFDTVCMYAARDPGRHDRPLDEWSGARYEDRLLQAGDEIGREGGGGPGPQDSRQEVCRLSRGQQLKLQLFHAERSR